VLVISFLKPSVCFNQQNYVLMQGFFLYLIIIWSLELLPRIKIEIERRLKQPEAIKSRGKSPRVVKRILIWLTNPSQLHALQLLRVSILCFDASEDVIQSRSVIVPYETGKRRLLLTKGECDRASSETDE